MASSSSLVLGTTTSPDGKTFTLQEGKIWMALSPFSYHVLAMKIAFFLLLLLPLLLLL